MIPIRHVETQKMTKQNSRHLYSRKLFHFLFPNYDIQFFSFYFIEFSNFFDKLFFSISVYISFLGFCYCKMISQQTIWSEKCT